MTLPASPPVSLAQVRAEFGAPAGTPLHAFVRGGAWVPNTTANANVPTAAPIRLAQLCDASAYTPMTPQVSPTSASGSITTATAGTYAVTTNPVTASATGGNASKTYAWSIVSGSGISINGAGSSTASFNTSIRVNAVTGSVIDSGTARCTINDGTSTTTIDVPLHFRANWTGSNL